MHLNGEAVKSCTVLAVQADGSANRPVDRLPLAWNEGLKTLDALDSALADALEHQPHTARLLNLQTMRSRHRQHVQHFADARSEDVV